MGNMEDKRKDYVAYRESEEYKHLKELRRKKRRQEVMIARICVFGGGALILLVIVLLIGNFLIAPNLDKETFSDNTKGTVIEKEEQKYYIIEEKPLIDVQLLTQNNYSRPGIATEPITNIVVHYTANPGTTAQQNRDFFEGLKDSHDTSVSSHFVIGLDGEIIQCVPTIERAYASNQRNFDTVSIECCHMDETGKFNEGTYDSLVQLCAWLCCKFNLQAEDVIRHYDVTGKSCPKYFVDNQGEWDSFIQEVDAYMNAKKKEVSKEEHDVYYGLAEAVATSAPVENTVVEEYEKHEEDKKDEEKNLLDIP